MPLIRCCYYFRLWILDTFVNITYQAGHNISTGLEPIANDESLRHRV